jgi:hypothetical protein
MSMSAYLCDDDHTYALADLIVADPAILNVRPHPIQWVIALALFKNDPVKLADFVASELRDENNRSLAARYGDAPVELEPRTQGALDVAAFSRLPDAAARVVKAAQCFDYQSCEHQGWDSSRARAWLTALGAAWEQREYAVGDYARAEWGWSTDGVPYLPATSE